MTKEEIIKTALKHFAKNGYENTSMQEIAKDLNITKPALYYHFKNKEHLYNAIFQHYFSQIDLKEFPNQDKRILHYIDTMYTFFSKNPFIAKLFAKELACEGEHLQKETLEIMSKTLKYLSPVLPKEINPFFIQTLIISAFTTYQNTISLREKVSQITKTPSNFDVKEEITKTILLYIKAKV